MSYTIKFGKLLMWTDPMYPQLWSRIAGIPYGPRSVRSAPLCEDAMHCPGENAQEDRIQMAVVLRNLYLATGVLPENLTHVVEFGAGTGQMAHVARTLGFQGLHLVIDMPQMLK